MVTENITEDILYKEALSKGFEGTLQDFLDSLQGASAYDLAVVQGYKGSLTDWLKTLKAKSLYELALEAGFKGSLKEWLETLKPLSLYKEAVQNGFEGDFTAFFESLKGASAYQLARQEGLFRGSLTDWLYSLQGESAYQIAVKEGFEGSVNTWLKSLQGKSSYDLAVDQGFKGSLEEYSHSLQGSSAYTLALYNGFKGSLEEWLVSLKGERGLSAYDFAVEQGYKGSLKEWTASLKDFEETLQQNTVLKDIVLKVFEEVSEKVKIVETLVLQAKGLLSNTEGIKEECDELLLSFKTQANLVNMDITLFKETLESYTNSISFLENFVKNYKKENITTVDVLNSEGVSQESLNKNFQNSLQNLSSLFTNTVTLSTFVTFREELRKQINTFQTASLKDIENLQKEFAEKYNNIAVKTGNGVHNFSTEEELLLFIPPENSSRFAFAFDTSHSFERVAKKWVSLGPSQKEQALSVVNENLFFKPGSLTVDSNLNDYKSNGTFIAGVASVTSLDRNFPTNKGGILEVYSGSLSIKYQRYTTHEEVFIRRLSGDTWSPWLRLATTDRVDTQVQEKLTDYVKKDTFDNIDSRTINSGKAYPFKALTRGGSVSKIHQKFSDFILDVKVIGAREGKVYKIDLFTNGSTQSGNKATGWTISEYDSTTFSTSTINDRYQVVRATEEQLPVNRETISKIVLKSQVVSGLSFEILIDGSKLPSATTELLRSSLETDLGYSWIIDPLTYTIITNTSQETLTKVTYKELSQETFIDFKSGSLWYRWVFGPNGFNNLPNFKGISKSSDGVSWSTLNSSTTDWLPPLRIQAVNNGDGRSKFATGGNHGNVSNSASGSKTAKNTLFKVFADGSLLTKDIETKASVVDMLVINEVMAWNTTPSDSNNGRYVLRQSFNLSFKGGSVEITATNTALEDCLLARDSALQMVVTGLKDSLCFYGKSLKQPWASNLTSGKKSLYPDVVAAGSFSSDTQLVMWLDRDYKKGDLTWLSGDAPLVRYSGDKAYMAVALDVDENQADIGTTVPLPKGTQYQYRGGYSLQQNITSPDIESSFIKHINAKAINNILTTSNDFYTV